MELSKKERRELKREGRQEELRVIAKRAKIKVFGILAVFLIILAAGLYFGYQYISKKASIGEMGSSFPIEGDKHVSDGTKVEYRTNPPTSGDHYGVPANWGVYDHEIPDEAAVHNLEHGGVWITYKPEIAETIKAKLIEITKSNSKVIMTPRAKNDAPIALVSWGRIYKPEISAEGAFDESGVSDFILKYKNTGPEKVPDSMPGKDY